MSILKKKKKNGSQVGRSLAFGIIPVGKRRAQRRASSVAAVNTLPGASMPQPIPAQVDNSPAEETTTVDVEQPPFSDTKESYEARQQNASGSQKPENVSQEAGQQAAGSESPEAATNPAPAKGAGLDEILKNKTLLIPAAFLGLVMVVVIFLVSRK
jgi:hypothetical protein